MAEREPDYLAAEARRWLENQAGPPTAPTSAALSALRAYYDDTAVLEGLVRYWTRESELELRRRGARSTTPEPAQTGELETYLPSAGE